MICRARPKFINFSEKDFFTSPKKIGKQRDVIFFNQGSNAFRFFLTCYKLFYNKTPNIGIQTFTCSSMLDAINNSGCNAYLYDVSFDDFAINFAEIEKDATELDILVLTHYQGLVTAQYNVIYHFCKKNSILFFEDLAHISVCPDSKDNIAGSSCNVFCTSYAWDKPFTTLTGGGLHLINLESHFKNFIFSEYEKLSTETLTHAKKEIKTIFFLLKYTHEDNYYIDFDYTIFMHCNFLIFFWNKFFFNFYFYRLLLVIIHKFFFRFQFKSNKIKKMHSLKINFIESQQKNYKHSSISLANILTKYNIQIKKFPNELFSMDCSLQTDWNRFSIYDPSDLLKNELILKKIHVGNFNWTVCLHEYAVNKKIRINKRSECHNAQLLCKHILNIPIWNLY